MQLTAISLFSGAMGLDLGFEKAGFEIRVASEIRPEVCKTIALNRPSVPLLQGDLNEYNTKTILKLAGLNPGEATVVIGGSPCQPFSTAGNRGSFNEKRGSVLFEYIRVVKESKPEYFVFENVKGLTNAALHHMPFYERIKKKENEIAEESRLGTAFKYVLEKLGETGYKIAFKILNAADYGSAQKRLRLIIIGSKNYRSISFPESTHDSLGSASVLTHQKQPWVTLRTALEGMKEKDQEYLEFPAWGKYMKHIKPGGHWRDLPVKLQKDAMKGSYYSQGGRTGYFRRLSWDSPCPTLVTSPIFKGTCLAHPDFNRPLSVQEYARLQGFPESWILNGNISQKYRMLGEAVPVELAYAVANAIKSSLMEVLEVEGKSGNSRSSKNFKMGR